MLRTQATRAALSAVAIAATAVLAAPTAPASPAPAVPGLPPLPGFAVPEGVPVDAIASLAPAIVGAAARDVAQDPQTTLLAQARQLLAAAPLPPEIKATLERLIKFLDGSGGGGPELPPKDGPVIAQFLYPTVGRGCISDRADSVGTALAVPGPAHLPPPGPKAGQAGFVFTALGTKPASEKQDPPLTVTWLNIDNGKSATQALTTAAKINPDGPATLSVISDTGRGRVLAVIGGSITTGKDAETRTCSFLPTIGMVNVG